jgi:glucose/arabinose dehydrogenase
MSQASRFSTVIGAISLFAVGCSDKPADSASATGTGATGTGATGSGATDTATTGTGGDASHDPSTLRVEFEELALDGEPTFITDFAFYPGSDTDFLALAKSGKLQRYRFGEQGATLVSSTQVDGVYDKLDCGAISLAFEPEFAEGRYVYVGTCVSLTHSEIVRLDLDDDQNVVAGSEVSVIRVGSTGATRPWHNIGSIGFEPGGILWALFGEKVQGAPAQDPTQNLGKLLRLVPSREPGLGGFEPAPDGPLVDTPDAAPAVYALGLRSPFRGTRDSRGFYWIGDVGSDFFEEVNVARQPLQDFGWPEHEGPCSDCGDTTSPAFFWAHGATPDYIADDPEVETTVARVAWVGPEVLPHDPDRYLGLLSGSVLFGDYCAGFLRQGRVDDDGIPTLDAPLGHLNNAAAFRQHSDGFLYAMTTGHCQTDVKNQADEGLSRMYRMVPED